MYVMTENLLRKIYPDNTGEGFDHFLERFFSAFNRIEEVLPFIQKVQGKCLDIGCGCGNGVAALLAHEADFAVGIDSNLFVRDIKEKIHVFNARLSSLGLNPLDSLLIEMDVFNASFLPDDFDLITMFDVAGHIPDPSFFFSWSFNTLKHGGYILVDTVPLYYNQGGPNRITYKQVHDKFIDAGFEMVFEHQDNPCVYPGRYEQFLNCKDDMNLQGIGESMSFEKRIIFVGRKK